ncbi:MAG: hypothetical protein ACPG5U_09595 [Planktomarina sp.]
MANFANVETSTSIVSRVLGTVGNFFVSIADAQSRSAEFKALNELSDKELSEIGLGRHDIAQHVFRDKMFM